MTDPGGGGWQSPSGGPPGGDANPYGGADPNQNYGLANPGPPVFGPPMPDPANPGAVLPGSVYPHPGGAYPPVYMPAYDVVVPRPPRPAALGWALGLTYLGVLIAFVEAVGSSIYQWQHRLDYPVGPTGPGQPDLTGATETFTTLGLAIGFLTVIGAATGIIICAILVNRKKNPARITLAVVMGVLAVYQLCGVGSGLMATAILDSIPADPAQDLDMAALEVPWWLMVGPALLCVIAAAVCVLLIIPVVNRYFSPGAGRRFAADS